MDTLFSRPLKWIDPEMTIMPFNSLPLEIRYMVWEYTWPSPVVIEPFFYRRDTDTINNHYCLHFHTCGIVVSQSIEM